MKHGANIYKYAKRVDCHEDEIIDFSSNINLHQPTLSLTPSASVIARYQDASYKEFREFLANNYALQAKQIALFKGATDAIHSLLTSIKRKNIFLYAPLYGEYEKAAIHAKKNIYKINRITDIENHPTENSIVIFVNPSTPEGDYTHLEGLIKKWIELNCTIILDESFLEFEELTSYRNMINEYKKLYIIQSFSKFYACAGVRVGAIFSCKKNIKKLSSPLWSISSLDIEFLKKRLSDEEFKLTTRELHKIQKLELQHILEESQLFDEIVESQSNFILTYSSRGEEIYEYLLQNKILVRKCASFDYLNNNWLRFAVKDVKSHQALKDSLLAFA